MRRAEKSAGRMRTHILNGRVRTALWFSLAVLFLALITILGLVFAREAVVTDFSRKNLPPS